MATAAVPGGATAAGNRPRERIESLSLFKKKEKRKETEKIKKKKPFIRPLNDGVLNPEGPRADPTRTRGPRS